MFILAALPLLSLAVSAIELQPVEGPKVKPPIIPPKHPKIDPGEKPVDPKTAAPPPADPALAGQILLAYPHPLVTEILYAVPSSEKGDANRDGSRHAAGDEFVELVNPHPRAIQLKGYTITDRNPPNKGQLKFTFPAFELPPGGVVVVFNGCEQGWGKGEAGQKLVGDSKGSPKFANPNFFGAFVFSAKNTSARTSWNNTGDYVLLSDPAGNPVHCLYWGDFAEPVPGATLSEKVPTTTKASIQRTALGGPFTAHTDLQAPEPPTPEDNVDEITGRPAKGGSKAPAAALKIEKGRLFSPGWFDFGKADGSENPGAAVPAAPKSEPPVDKSPKTPAEKPGPGKRDK